MIASGAVRPHIHATLPLTEVAQGHEMLEKDDVFGKVVLFP